MTTVTATEIQNNFGYFLRKKFLREQIFSICPNKRIQELLLIPTVTLHYPCIYNVLTMFLANNIIQSKKAVTREQRIIFGVARDNFNAETLEIFRDVDEMKKSIHD